MPYEHRFGRTSRRNDCRHDPGYTGIFIHGGTCCAGPFFNQHSANRFSITIPTRNPLDQEIDLSKTHPVITGFPKPTFQSALAHAKALREAIPALTNCPIFACTDLQMDTHYSGRVAVQRVA
ncbi:MAG: hypothetical protein QOF48_3720 [Verrucomicrobiota bacterium]|jgi:hypothetical protein